MPIIHYHNLKPKAKSSFTVRRPTGLRSPSVTIIKKLPYYITT